MNAQHNDKNQAVEAFEELAMLLKEGRGTGAYLGYSDQEYSEIEEVAYKYYQHSKFDECVDILKGLLQLAPTRAYPLLLSGEVAYRQGRYEDALSFYRRAVKEAPHSLTARVKLAQCHLMLGQKKQALPILDWAMSMDVEDAHPVMRRAKVLRVIAAK